MVRRDVAESRADTAILTSLEVGLIVAVIAATSSASAAAMAIRELARCRGCPRARSAAALHPRREPGTGDGAVLSRGRIPASLFTIAIVQIVWALPFATLVIVIAMSTFDPVYLEAASMSGANRLRGFLDVELPLIRSGIFGAATFSLILSFNETIRTSVVQGGYNTVQTYIWATYKQIGLSPTLYALMSLLILLDLRAGRGLSADGARGRASILDRYDCLRREAHRDVLPGGTATCRVVVATSRCPSESSTT